MSDSAPPESGTPDTSGDVRLWLIDASAYIFRAYHALPPLTRKSDGLPVGMQLIGPHFSEETLLRTAHAYETATEWSSARPEI